MSRPLLRGAWLPWSLALLVAAGSAVAGTRLRSEREDLVSQTTQAREELADARVTVVLGKRRLEQEEQQAETLDKSFRICLTAVRADRPLLSAWIDHLAASRDEDYDRAEQIFDGIDPLTKKANRTLRRCQDQVS